MTTPAPTPDLAQDLIRIHRVITRSLNITKTKGKEFLVSGFPSDQCLLGYTSYTHCLLSVLGSHHQGEDLIAFPAFRKVLPSAPYAQLLMDHHGIETLLAQLAPAIADVSSDAPDIGLRIIVDTIQKMLEIWEPHIQLEEYYFSREALSAVLDSEEQRLIGEAASKHSQEHSGPPYWVIPFILFNLDRKDRETMAASFPPMIMDDLVPKVWKDQWAPMKSFLLD